MRLRVPKAVSEAAAQKAERRARRRRVWKRIGQAVLIVAFVGTCAGGWMYHRAEAQMSAELVELGEHMMVYADARRQDAPRDLVLNGQIIRFSSGTTPHSADEVLDYYEARCAEVDGQLQQQMQDLADAHPEAAGEMPDRPSMRRDDGERGYVTCLDMGPDEVSVTELVDRLGRYGETGDVYELGEIRYVFAEEAEIDGQTQTHFVAMWSQGSFNVNRMFPEDGDVPGDDVPGLARPDDSRRVLSGFERGVPHTLTVYETRMDETELATFYRSSLRDAGFELVSQPDQVLDPASPRMFVAEQGERMVTVVFQDNPATGATSAAVFDVR